MSDKTSSSSGIGLGGCLLCIFVTLKLLGKIGWSWWWVCSPIWIPFLVVVAILFLVGLIALIKTVLS